MTCRVDRRAVERGIVLYVSGRISVGDLEILRSALEEGPVVAIDLAAIELVDRDAVLFLAGAEDRGIALMHCPAFIREWIAREQDRHESRG